MMTCVVRLRLVVVFQVSAVSPCWAVHGPRPALNRLHASCTHVAETRPVVPSFDRGRAYCMLHHPRRPCVAPGDRALAGAAAPSTHPRQPNRYLGCSPAPPRTRPNRDAWPDGKVATSRSQRRPQPAGSPTSRPSSNSVGLGTSSCARHDCTHATSFRRHDRAPAARFGQRGRLGTDIHRSCPRSVICPDPSIAPI